MVFDHVFLACFFIIVLKYLAHDPGTSWVIGFALISVLAGQVAAAESFIPFISQKNISVQQIYLDRQKHKALHCSMQNLLLGQTLIYVVQLRQGLPRIKTLPFWAV